MKLKLLAAWARRVIHWVNRMGFKRALEGVRWKCKTALYKRYLSLQDRLGWYTYADWLRENDPEPLPASGAKLEFGFLIPVVPEGVGFLRLTLASLQAQTYPRWRAWLVYELGTGEAIRQVIAALPDGEQRVHQLELDSGIALADGFGIALEAANSDWIGVLGCGDRLHPAALSIFQDAIHRYPHAQVIYTDEDQLSQDGNRRHSPFFKPDWSPELLLSVNFLRHAIFHQQALREAARHNADCEGAQYRCARQVTCIVHLPQVLFHCHALGARPWISLFPREETLKTYLQQSGLEEVQCHSDRRGVLRLTWRLEPALVSIIIPTCDQVLYLKRCIQSILERTPSPPFEIILVENNSRQAETFAYYEQLERSGIARLLRLSGAFNYSAANNLGAQHARGNLLLFLNNDIEVIEAGWLDELARWSICLEVGVVGGKMLYPNGAIQHAGIVFGMEGHASHVFAGEKEGSTGLFGSVDWYRNYLAVTGACMLMRREVFQQVGGFDERFTLAFSDIDLCLRVYEAGYRIVYTPYARLRHYEGRTRYGRIPSGDIQLGAQRFRRIVSAGDPFYNPNLSLSVKVPTLRRSNEESPLERLENIVRYG